MREASERLALCAHGIREHLGYVDPEARARGHGERRYEPEDAEHRQCSRRIRQRQLPGDEGVHGDHRRGADHYEDAPPHPVDYGERNRGEDEVHEPHAHRAGECRERRPLAEYHLENPRRIVVDRVDSADLVEERDEERKKDGLQEPALEKRHVDTVCRRQERRLYLLHGFRDSLAPHAREHLRGEDVLLLHGDLVCEAGVLAASLASEDSSMTVSSTLPLPEKDFKAVIRDGRITAVGIEFFDDALAAQPLYKLMAKDWDVWLDNIIAFCESDRRKCYAEVALNEVTDACLIRPLDFADALCAEVDTPDDLAVVSAWLARVDKNA